MADKNILITHQADVAIITINRPDVFNALNASVLRELANAITNLGEQGARAIIITGSGEKAFSAGADLSELSGLDAAAAHDLLTAGQREMATIEASKVPVIAAVNGLALGGGFELVLACTFPILAEKATLGLPESGLGLIPGYGGTQRLPLIVGRAVAAHTMLTGERIGALRAYELGLTPLAPVPARELLNTAKSVANTIAARGPRAQSAILTALRTAAPNEPELRLESALAGVATGSREAAEGIAAFQEKRPATFPSPSRR